jgi:hypothetical protein
VQSSAWASEPAYDNKISDDFVVGKLNSSSKIKCVSECDKRTDCASVFYMKTPPLCQLHSVRFPSHSSDVLKYSKPKPGTKYFYNKNANAITTPTTSTTTTTTPTTMTSTSKTMTSTTTTTPATTQHCAGYQYFSNINKYINILPEVNSWDVAKTNCKANGGHLLSVKDNATWKAVATYANSSNMVALWVNARYDDTKADFVWQDDFSSLKNNPLWTQDQPQYPLKDTKCVMMLQMYAYLFDDTECVNENGIHPLCYCT